MRIRYDPKALAQLDHILDYIAQDNPRAAVDTVSYIRKTVERLRLFPQSGRPGSVAGTRELVVPGTPYIIVYRTTTEEIQILGAFHGAQRR